MKIVWCLTGLTVQSTLFSKGNANDEKKFDCMLNPIQKLLISTMIILGSFDILKH